MEESECTNDIEMKGFSSIDDVSENDKLIGAAASSHSLKTGSEPISFELIGDVDANNLENSALVNGQSEQLPQLLEISEPELSRKNGKCNLRKSLAWDSAFFECPGVLDAEELSSMIEGAEKGKRQFLPGIQEDICRSTESISTLASDNLDLECFEDVLFEDIRASIQKSSKASNVTNPSHRAAVSQVNHSAKTANLSSQNRLKTKPASKKQTNGMQGSGNMIKKGLSSPQITQTASRTGNSISSLSRLQKESSRAEPVSSVTTKRASLGANRLKSENNNAKSTSVGGKGVQVPNATGWAGPRRIVPKPALSSKSASSASCGTKTEPTMSSSSCDSSSSSLPEKIGKSPLASARGKFESGPVIKPSPGLIPKASSKVPLRKKPSKNSDLSTFLMSPKISSSISPASSISEWSSASSSTSTVNQRSNLRASLDISSPCRSIDNEAPPLDLNFQSSDHNSDGNVNLTGLRSEAIKKASMQNGMLSRPSTVKPSGLRMPSPKIGFFDGAKSALRTPVGGRQSLSRLPTGLPKIAARISSPVGSSNKASDGKYPPGITVPTKPNKAVGKIPPGMTVITSSNTKPDGKSFASPKPFQEPSSASVEASKACRAVRSPGISPKVQHETGGVSCLKAKDKETGRVQHITVSAPDPGKNADFMEIKTSPAKGNNCDSSTNNCIEHLNPTEVVGEDKTHGEHSRDDSLLSIIDMKKIILEDQTGGSQVSMQKELTDSMNSQCEVSNLELGQKEVSKNDLLPSDRTPFSTKNSLCNIEGFDFSIATGGEVLEKTVNLDSSVLVHDENS